MVYDELCQLAAAYLRRERADHTLDAPALVHEAYLRLIDQRRVQWRNRAHFFGIAAQAMRRILVDHARRRCYAKRGGDRERFALDDALFISAQRAPELVALDDALKSLEALDADQAKIVELRYFAGLTTGEIATLLDSSSRTVTRRWRMARAWLFQELSGR